MKFHYPETLPISQKKNDILEAIKANQVTIVAGDTGSGKTTQIPKICLEILEGTDGIVGCTQPRRVAAMTVSQRVADELTDQAHLVGYKIRFHDHTNENSRIIFMTDGVLLAETRHDRLLHKYSVLIIDEAHERSLNIDFLIGYVKNLLKKRHNLKVVITSATIDTTAFSKHFDNAPVITIPGKTYPIEVRHAPPQTDEFGEAENFIEKCVEAAYHVYMQEPPGDILIFLPTEKDIRTCCELLESKVEGTTVLPLFGRLQASDQKKIFKPVAATKIVVATNVAETSITVPGIRYVIDTGLARMAHYNSRSKTNSLPIRKISRASCDQRKGRCGRIGPGVCIRLYQEDDYLQREEFSIPEIKRSNLAEVILQMLSFQLGDPFSFPFLDPPHPSSVKEGYRTLFELGAIDEHKKLSKIGKIMASLPIDPAIARIIIEAQVHDCLKEIMVIASVLAIQDPRVRPADLEHHADKAHAQFTHPQSDFLTFLNVWNLFHNVKVKTSWSRLKKFCKSHYLSFQKMREWLDLHEQMTKIIKRNKRFKLNNKEASYDSIHKSIMIGFLRNIGLKKSKNIYLGSSGREVMIFPGSGQFNKNPQWLLAASFLETSRLYALNVATIQPEWLESAAGNLCKLSWSMPHYHKKSGQVLANEKVTLFGLVIVQARKVNFGKTNRGNQLEARKLFIQNALVEGQLNGRYDFLKNNLQLVKKWNNIEERVRMRDIVVNEQAIFDFYDTRLPVDVYDRASLQKFLKKTFQKQLYFDEGFILNRKPPGQELADFPKRMSIKGNSFRLQYVFDPSSEKDGVTIRIPSELLENLDPNFFDWIVPGLLREKTAFLLKSLPKRIRKHLIPLNITVDYILDDIDLFKGSYYRAIENSIFKRFKLTIKRSDWIDELPPYLRMRICLIDLAGKEIAQSRNFADLVQNMSTDQAPQNNTEKISRPAEIQEWEKISTRVWDFKNLPRKVPLSTNANQIAGYLYPALLPDFNNSAVSIQFFNQKAAAIEQSQSGLRCLYRLQYSNQYKALKRYCNTALSGPSAFWLVSIFKSKSEMVDAILDFIIDSLFDVRKNYIPEKHIFEERINKVPKNDFFSRGSQICSEIMATIRQRQEVITEIQRYEKLSRDSNTFVAQQYVEYNQILTEILPHDFLQTHNFEDFEDLRRYMKSLKIRISRAHSDATKDKRKAETIAPYLAKLEQVKLSQKHISNECNNRINEFIKHIQEYRISLFSPEIKTKFSISEKKLQAIWLEIEREC